MQAMEDIEKELSEQIVIDTIVEQGVFNDYLNTKYLQKIMLIAK